MDVVTYALLEGEIEEAAPDLIAEATDEWLEENIAQETGYVLDTTLSMSNAAAPADLVGDIKSDVEDLSDDLESLDDTVSGLHTIPTGGTSGQVLAKASGTDYDVEWVDQTGGGGTIDLPYATPEQYGAVGDGTTDDYQAFADCFANESYIFLDNKTYRVEGTIVIERPTYLVTNNTTLKVAATNSVRDFESLIRIEDYVYHTGKLKLDLNYGCNIGLFTKTGGQCHFGHITVTKARVWGVFVSNTGNNNFIWFDYIAASQCGYKVKATASRVDNTHAELTDFTESHISAYPALKESIFNNNYLQMRYVIDDSEYIQSNRDGRYVMVGQYPSEAFDYETGIFTCSDVSDNYIPNDYLNKAVFIPLGGSVCFDQKAEGGYYIGTLVSNSSPHTIHLGQTFGGHIGSLCMQDDTIYITTTVTYGTTIDYVYIENPGSGFTNASFCPIYLITSRSDTSINIGNGMFPSSKPYIKDENIVRVDLSYSDFPEKQRNLVCLGREVPRFMGIAQNGGSTIRGTYTETSPRDIVQTRAGFSTEYNHITLGLDNVSNKSNYRNFMPLNFYYHNTSASLNTVKINIPNDLVTAGYSLKGATDGVLQVELPDEYSKLTVILFNKEFDVFVEPLQKTSAEGVGF